MAITQKIVTKNFNISNALDFIETFDDNQYFMYVGNHLEYPGSDGTIPVPDNSIQKSIIDVYNNMIFAKGISKSDIIPMIKNYEWTSGTVYTEYNHTNPNLYDEQFYTVVDDTTEYNVYKCLSNNNGSPSIVSPTRVGSNIDLNPIITGDNYIWKYMFTITKAEYQKFSSRTYIPVTANTVVMDNSIPGSIEVIKIVDAGSGYNNYIKDGIFLVGDINIGGSTLTFGAPTNSIAIDQYYQGCYLKLTSGNGIDQYRKIVGFDGTSAQKKFTINEPFAISPKIGDTYEVYPSAFVWGDGTETKPAEGRAIINPAGNTINNIEMLSVGRNYRTGQAHIGETPNTNMVNINSVFIQLPSVISSDVNFTPAILQPIISPPDGHGSNPYEELYANRVCISTKLTSSEGGIIPAENDFRQVGIIKNPEFKNVDIKIDTSTSVGSFIPSEEINQFKQYKLYGRVDVVSGNPVIQKSDFGEISTVVDILSAGSGYDSTANNELVFNNSGTGGTGATGTFANNASGEIVSILITSVGTGYEKAPEVSINSTASVAAFGAQLEVELSNPEIPSFDDSFNIGDLILINKGNLNFISKVKLVPNYYQIILEDAPNINLTDATVSALKITASGQISSYTVGQMSLTNIKGDLIRGGKILGKTSNATSTISKVDPIEINDRLLGGFDYSVQLTKLIGDFSVGAEMFLEDEKVVQESLIGYAEPYGYLHHTEINPGINDDILYISNEYGIFNLDPNGNRTIIGKTSGAMLNNLLAKYPGDFVRDSGTVLYYENIDPITRDGNKSEMIKIILEF